MVLFLVCVFSYARGQRVISVTTTTKGGMGGNTTTLASIPPPVSGGGRRRCVWTGAIFFIIYLSCLCYLFYGSQGPQSSGPPPLSFIRKCFIAIRANTSVRVKEIVYGLVSKIFVFVCACVSNIWAGYGRVDKETSIRSNQARGSSISHAY